MRFGIPSYKRPACPTIDMLLKYGVLPNDIFVSIQAKEEMEAYKKAHPQVNYIYREADCAAGNRNTLIEALGAPLVLLDDDISSMAIKLPGKNFKSVEDAKTLFAEIKKIVDVGKKNNCQIIGIAPTTNDIIARNRERYSFDCALQGSFLIMLDNIMFNEKWKMVEDYEIALRTIRKGGHTLRANALCARKPKNGTNEGGLHERYVNGELGKWIARLASVYPEFKPNKDKTGGHIKFG